MNLPYENATSGDRALADIEKTIRAFGCNKFGNWMDYDKKELTIQFEYRDRPVQIRASAQGYAAAYLKTHPYSHRMRKTRNEHEQQALEQGMISIYSIVRDWIKGQITAVETGILSFEGAFLGQILLPSGKTVLEHVQSNNMLLENKSDEKP